MATAELAAALPALVAVLLLALGLLATASAALRCEDAARLGARSMARGDGAAASTALTRSAAPAGASVQLVAAAPAAGRALVRVRVTARVRLPGPLGSLIPTMTVTGTAAALDESPSTALAGTGP